MSRVARLLGPLARSVPFQVALLGAFFFTNEMGGYFVGVISCTMLVKKAGAQILPYIYVLLNLGFLPIALLAILYPPRSSYSMLIKAQLWFLIALAVVFVFFPIDSAFALGAIYVSARLGKLMVSSCQVGMVAEVLSLREAKAAMPTLLVCTTAATIVGGLLVRPMLAVVGTLGTFVVLWATMLVSLGVVVLLGACGTAGSGGTAGPRPPAVDPATGGGFFKTIRASVAELLTQPLLRVMGMVGFYLVGLRYLVEFTYASVLSKHCQTGQEMASFSGNFEAALSVTVVLCQLVLVAPLMRRLRVGGMSLILPGFLAVSLFVATSTQTFVAVVACQFLYWVMYDSFQKPVHQVMMGAVRPDLRSRAPVLMTVMQIVGSLCASVLLLPLAHGALVWVMLLSWVVALLFLWTSAKAGGVYLSTLSQTLEMMDTAGAVQILTAVRTAEEAERIGAVTVLLSSTDANVRRLAAKEAATLPREQIEGPVLERLAKEDDATVRATLLSTLAEVRVPGLAGILVQHLSDPDVRVRANALEGLCSDPTSPLIAPLARERLSSSHPRERVAAVLVTLRVSSDPELLRQAVDLLAAMVEDPREDHRCAAAAAMGRLGYVWFLPDLESLMRDPAASVRRTAVEALQVLDSPLALPCLQEALARETDSKVSERITETLLRLQDDTVISIRGVLDTLGKEERSKVKRLLSLRPDEGRLKLLSAALDVEDPALRLAFVEVTGLVKDTELLTVLLQCLKPDDKGPRMDLEPLLEHLVKRSDEAIAEGYEVLQRLLQDPARDGLASHVARATGRLWRLVAIAEALSSRPDGERFQEVTQRVRGRQEQLLDHILAVSGRAADDPDRAVKVMRASLTENRYLSSLSLELLEDWLPDAIKRELLPTLEALPDPSLRRKRAFERTGLSPEQTPPEVLVERARQEDLE